MSATAPTGCRLAWRRPPDSTEQVLHPEKFFSREAPRVVAPGRRPRGGWLVSQGVFGELLLRSLPRRRGASSRSGGGAAGAAMPGASGTSTAAPALLWASVWDDRAEAEEFEAALRARFARRREAGSPLGPWALFEGPAAWRFAVRRDGDTVELASSDDPDALLSLLAPD